MASGPGVLTRDEAVDLLVRDALPRLSIEQRETNLLDWWSVDELHPGYAALPELLKATLKGSEQPEDPGKTLYDPLLSLSLARDYRGVSNGYLEACLARLGCSTKVEGSPEPMATCPCCHYACLDEADAFEVCRVCFWEDDGRHDPSEVSGPNHMSLAEAQKNFASFGAMSEVHRSHVLPDGPSRYPRATR